MSRSLLVLAAIGCDCKKLRFPLLCLPVFGCTNGKNEVEVWLVLYDSTRETFELSRSPNDKLYLYLVNEHTHS